MNTRRGMTAFIKYINGTDPQSPVETVNYLRGLNANGSTIVDPTTSLPTTFMLSGDPVGQIGWLDDTPSDRRMLICSGPFSMGPGAVQEIWLAIVIGAGSDRLASIQALRLSDDAAQQTFDAGFTGPTAVDVSLVGTEVGPQRALITWQVANRSEPVTVYRAQSGMAWQALGTRIPDGSGRVQFEDTALKPATRYGYRLGVPDGGVEVAAGEVWVTTPASAEFALRGMSPNPAVAELWVSFSLPNDVPATLELLDLSGRRVLAADAGQLGAGVHRLSLGKSANVPPGVYLVRLRQGVRSLITKAAVVR